MNVTALARKPVIRNVEGSVILSEIQESKRPDKWKRLVSVYLADAGVQIMYERVNNKIRWHGAWAPITKREAIECAREQAYKKKVAPQNNLFFIPRGFDRGESGYLWVDVDAGSNCFNIDALAKYQDRGDDCLLVLYHAAHQEVQQYRLCNGLCEWWHKSSPHTLEAAKRIANRVREERRLTFDQVRFIEALTRMQ